MVEKQNNDLKDVNRNYEVETKEQRQRLETLTYELDLAKNELRELRETNRGLDTTKFS
jgi:hypothetical protein